MTSRSRRKTISFEHPFRLRSDVAVGCYAIVTDKETIEGLSFADFHGVATMMMGPARVPRGAMKMLAVDAAELSDTRVREAAHG